MGRIWIADHRPLQTQVAVKFLSGDFAEVPEAVARFTAEATAAARIRSPHVAQVFDHGVSNGRPYIVMELLEGKISPIVSSAQGPSHPTRPLVAPVRASRPRSSPRARPPAPRTPLLTRGRCFFEARRLMAEERWEEACSKLERSERLDPGMGTEFNLAACYEHVGRIGSAYVLFERVVAESRASNQTAHEALAKKRADALRTRVPVLVVDVSPEVRALSPQIARDDEPLPTPLWSTPIQLDPGEHTIRARASGHETWEKTVSLVERASVTVAVPMLEPLPATTTDAPSTPPAAAPPEPPPAKPDRPSAPGTQAGKAQRTVGLVLGGAGAAGLAASGVFAALSLSARSDSKQWCNDTTNACTSQQGVDARNAAIGRGDAATALLVTGATLVAAGVIAWLTAPSRAGVHPSTAPANAWLGGGVF
jgi:hypothetical protein